MPIREPAQNPAPSDAYRLPVRCASTAALRDCFLPLPSNLATWFYFSKSIFFMLLNFPA